jgi:cytochrome c biogenesis protein CcdA
VKISEGRTSKLGPFDYPFVMFVGVFTVLALGAFGVMILVDVLHHSRDWRAWKAKVYLQAILATASLLSGSRGMDCLSRLHKPPKADDAALKSPGSECRG